MISQALARPGMFYALQLVPDITPGRVKLGWTRNLPQRLNDHRCTSPRLTLLGAWPCHPGWEPGVLSRLAGGATRVGGEVVDVPDPVALVREAERFFGAADRTAPPTVADRNPPGPGAVRVGVEEYLPLPQAAQRLGISASALRRRLRAGTAQAERRPSAGGFTWFVLCPTNPAPTPRKPTPTPTPSPGVSAPTPELATAQEAVRRLEAHVASLTEELGARRREVAELHVTMNRLLLALPAPAAPSTNGVVHDQAGAERADEVHAGVKKWWRRWFGWAYPAAPEASG